MTGIRANGGICAFDTPIGVLQCTAADTGQIDVTERDALPYALPVSSACMRLIHDAGSRHSNEKNGSNMVFLTPYHPMMRTPDQRARKSPRKPLVCLSSETCVHLILETNAFAQFLCGLGSLILLTSKNANMRSSFLFDWRIT